MGREKKSEPRGAGGALPPAVFGLMATTLSLEEEQEKEMMIPRGGGGGGRGRGTVNDVVSLEPSSPRWGT